MHWKNITLCCRYYGHNYSEHHIPHPHLGGLANIITKLIHASTKHICNHWNCKGSYPFFGGTAICAPQKPTDNSRTPQAYRGESARDVIASPFASRARPRTDTLFTWNVNAYTYIFRFRTRSKGCGRALPIYVYIITRALVRTNVHYTALHTWNSLLPRRRRQPHDDTATTTTRRQLLWRVKIILLCLWW